MSRRSGKPSRRVHFFFPEEMAVEILDEAKRLDRSPSWLLEMVWKIARGRLATARVHSTRAA